ncbi:MAG TPA: hydantoinase/oxoprolinase family protein [Sedimenticola sp.]|nr:hydantoinase/oxoprolinase family protein [Sedimenticola sp.]
MKLIGIDTGGTFTDFVLFEQGRLRVHKVLSTPHAPEEAILRGIADLGLDPAGLKVVHGSTVATNAALEGKGVRTVYIGNRGLADLLTIGRQAREELYNLRPGPRPPPVPRELCLETGGRLAADGAVVEPLTGRDLDELRSRLAELRPEAVAVNLLFSYLDDRFERAIAAVAPEGVFVSLSSRVLPEIREYERGMATWLNAWLGPLVEGYLQRLGTRLPGARVAVMQSSGETIAADQAADQAVRMLLSGPAGGLVGARFVGRASGREQLLSFDMGGTSTDVALIDGAPRLTNEGRIGPYPVAVPMVDMHTIGAGGGSIARIDAGGMLQVGPESAGADPGPACYGRGGERPTVTDANLVLGRLRADAFLGGRMRLDEGAARAALGALAGRMGTSPEEAAMGVIRVANEHMARALRVISVQRGVDPRGFTLISFGGAGGLHVCALAEALGMRHALAPVHAGVLSALGMLATRPGRQLSRTRLGLLADMDAAALERELEQMAAGGRAALGEEGVAAEAVMAEYSLDLRYRGQSYTLNVPWTGIAGAAEAFARRHEARYGHRMGTPVELVNLRVALHGPAAPVSLDAPDRRDEAVPETSGRVYGIGRAVPVYPREALAAGQLIAGPALITETVATTWLAPGWICRVDGVGNLLLERRPV